MEKYISELTAYIKAFDGLELKRDTPVHTKYESIGVIIIDGILQAGVNYESVYRRVIDFGKKFPNTMTTSAFYNILKTEEFEKTLNWKGQKPEYIRTLTKLLKDEDVETREDFSKWLSDKGNLIRLSTLKGVKGKTIEYFRAMTGHDDAVAIDVHLLNFIKKACDDFKDVSSDNEYAKNLLKKIFIESAKRLDIKPVELDYSIWSYMSQKKN